jgi:hypothetical protein
MNMISKNNLNYRYESINIVCKWCTGNHSSRNCHSEKMIKSQLKIKVGTVMEQFVEKCIECPRCFYAAGNNYNKENFCSFTRLANNTPSLDIECTICGLQIEVKSKCLSINNLPDQIYCKAGNYDSLINNIYDNQLNIIVIIYSADRITKNITIKEILWIDNKELYSESNVFINKIPNTTLCNITITNRNNIPKLPFDIKNISFETYINKLVKNIK